MDERKALVATPVARDRAIEKLQDHYAKSHLEVEDFERLVEMAERASTDEELVRLFDGLPPLEEVALVPAGRLTTTIGATLGATSRRGRWRVPKLVKAKATLGSVELDFTDAELQLGETVVEVRALLGSIEITVPEGLAVECEGSAILGSFDHVAQTAASRRDQRVLRIVGTATLGSVDVKVRRKDGVLAELGRAVRGLLGP
jgi:hypothetical protein